jgi:hypothetical protein
MKKGAVVGRPFDFCLHFGHSPKNSWVFWSSFHLFFINRVFLNFTACFLPSPTPIIVGKETHNIPSPIFLSTSASCLESLCFPRVFHDKMHGAGDFVFFRVFPYTQRNVKKKQSPPCLIQRNEKKTEVPTAHTFPMPFFGASTKKRLSGQEADLSHYCSSLWVNHSKEAIY